MKSKSKGALAEKLAKDDDMECSKKKNGGKFVEAEKAEDEDEEDDEEDEGDEGEDEDEEDGEKSLDLTSDDLEKSLARLSGYVDSNDSHSRKDSLLSKAQRGRNLSKSERVELLSLLGGGEKQAESLGEQITKSMGENSTIQEALDVSSYLDAQHQELCKSLTTLANQQEASDARQVEFNLLLAKAVSNVGSMLQSFSGRLGDVERQPARSPMSKGIAPLQKSFGGQAPAGEELSKSQILDTLYDMFEKSAGNNSLGVAVSKYESQGTIQPALLAQVLKHHQQNSAQ